MRAPVKINVRAMYQQGIISLSVGDNRRLHEKAIHMNTVGHARTHILFSGMFNEDVKVIMRTVPHLNAGARAAVIVTVQRMFDFPSENGAVEEHFCDIMQLAPSIRYHTGRAAALAGLALAEFELSDDDWKEANPLK